MTFGSPAGAAAGATGAAVVAGAAGAAVVGAAVGVIVTVLVTAGVGAADRGAAVGDWLAAVGVCSTVTAAGDAHAATPSSAPPSSVTPIGTATLAILMAHQAFPPNYPAHPFTYNPTLHREYQERISPGQVGETGETESRDRSRDGF